MKKNYIFLILGLSSTMLSKYIQFFTSSKIGDYIVLFSGIFFVCAIAFSIEKFNRYYEKNKIIALVLVIQTSLVVLSFQIMMILVVNKYLIGLVLLIPILGLIYFIYPKWMNILR
jgi:hypothetical protein